MKKLSFFAVVVCTSVFAACVKKENRVNIDLQNPNFGQTLPEGTNFLFKAHITADNEVARTYKLFAIEDDGSAFTDTICSHTLQTNSKDFYIEKNQLLPTYTGSKNCKFGVKMTVDGSNETSTVSHKFTIQ